MSGLDRRRFLGQAGGAALLSCAPAWASRPAGEVFAPEADGAPEAAAIFWKSGAGPGQVAVLAGHALKNAAISIARLPDDESPSPARPAHGESGAEPAWEHAHAIAQEDNYAYVEVPGAWKAGIYAVRVKSDRASETILHLNRPETWWCLGESGPTAAPESELRIFGQFFPIGEKAPMVSLVDAGLRRHAVEVTQANPYALTVRLPASAAAGRATVQIHNGFGGKAGWSEPIAVEIATPQPWPATTFNVTAFGAVGDSLHDDTAAFREALASAERNHGGVVLAPRGVYRITAQLTVPPQTALRGESRETVWLMVPHDVTGLNTVIAGMGEFAVEDLSIVAQSPARIVTAPDVPSMYTAYAPYGDPGEATASGIRLRRLRIHHLRYAHRVGTADKDPRRLEDAGPSTIALAGSRLSIRDCVVVSPGMPIVLHRISQSQIAGNEFRIGRNGWYGFWGARETAVEDNTFEGQDLEASYGSFANYGDGSGPAMEKLYVAGNRFRNSFGGEREAITFDSSGAYPWKGAIASAAARAIILPVDPPETTGDWAGLGCLITGGRGLGQLRRVSGRRGRIVSLDAPWDVTPDQTSTAAVLPLKRDVVVYRNDSQDASVGVQLWGGGYNFIVQENRTVRSGGFWGSAAEYTDTQTTPATEYFLPLYFTQWLRNEVREGFVFEQGPDTTNGAVCGLYVRDVPERRDGGVLTFANVVRDNRMSDRAKLVLLNYSGSRVEGRAGAVRALRARPWSLATLIEDNTVTDGPVGIDVAEGFDGVLLRRNRFVRVVEQVRGSLPTGS